VHVTCIGNEPGLLADHQRGRATGYESVYPLTVGADYQVAGIVLYERVLGFLIRDDHGGPCFAPAGFFELFTDVMPSNWVFSLRAGVRASGPDLWTSPDVAVWGYQELVEDELHLTHLMERVPSALAIFNARTREGGEERIGRSSAEQDAK
jgi:hypothetical protein